MQHPVVVIAARCLINVSPNALGFREVKGCALDRRDGACGDAVLTCGNVMVSASSPSFVRAMLFSRPVQLYCRSDAEVSLGLTLGLTFLPLGLTYHHWV